MTSPGAPAEKPATDDGAPAEAVDCSVLIPVLDEERHIEQSIRAMQGQRFGGRLEFIFADGGSTDRTKPMLKAAAALDPRVIVIDNPRRTVTSGLNVALGRARGRWVARMDAHTTYPSDYVSLGVTRLLEGGTRWVSGPPLPVGHGRVSRAVSIALGTDLGRSGSRKWTQAEDPEASEYELDSGVFSGVWERRTLLEYGGWDERWTVNEDSEMAGRFLENGERLICVPAMASRYTPRDSLPALWRQYSLYGRHRVKTAVAHPDTLRREHLAAPLLVMDGALAIAGPRTVRGAARLGLGLYAATLTRSAWRSIRSGERIADAMLVPAVLATMHFAWGTGTWHGVVCFGVPAEAVVAAARGRPGLRQPSSAG